MIVFQNHTIFEKFAFSDVNKTSVKNTSLLINDINNQMFSWKKIFFVWNDIINNSAIPENTIECFFVTCFCGALIKWCNEKKSSSTLNLV